MRKLHTWLSCCILIGIVVIVSSSVLKTQAQPQSNSINIVESLNNLSTSIPVAESTPILIANSVPPTPTQSPAPTPQPDACCDKAETQFDWDRDGDRDPTFGPSRYVQVGDFMVHEYCSDNFGDIKYWVWLEVYHPSDTDCHANYGTLRRNAYQHIVWTCKLMQRAMQDSLCDATLEEAKEMAKKITDGREAGEWKDEGVDTCNDTYKDLNNNKYGRDVVAPAALDSDGDGDCYQTACNFLASKDETYTGQGDGSDPMIAEPSAASCSQ
jgi:hypothetical protein